MAAGSFAAMARGATTRCRRSGTPAQSPVCGRRPAGGRGGGRRRGRPDATAPLKPANYPTKLSDIVAFSDSEALTSREGGPLGVVITTPRGGPPPPPGVVSRSLRGGHRDPSGWWPGPPEVVIATPRGGLHHPRRWCVGAPEVVIGTPGGGDDHPQRSRSGARQVPMTTPGATSLTE